MQFFFLVLVNIFIGAVLYLVISLKLERSAQEFRSQRLRKEMDEIIKEFNATAERNITLLENRITVLQRLLERSGSIKSLDISVGDGPVAEVKSAPPPDPVPIVKSAVPPSPGGVSEFSRKIVRRMRDGMVTLLDALDRNARSGRSDSAPARMGEIQPPEPSPEAGNGGIETVYLDENEIRDMIMSAENRYEAISRLHGQGYSLEEISRCSGIPVGEITLVLNLQHSRNS